MWLVELNNLVIDLSKKIDQHGEILQKSESATRYCLIDPLLTALGWDLSDPTEVRTEYKLGNGKADYAMLPGGGPPSLVVEAKSLHTPTKHGIEQSINYCLQDGIEYFAITNGNDWEVYETHRKGDIFEKRVSAFKITDMNQSTAMGMPWLWRGKFKGGPGKPPPPPNGEAGFQTNGDPNGAAGSQDAPTGEPLSQLTDVTGKAPPQKITFPDGKTKTVGKWNRVQIATVEWLVETGGLSESNCPLTSPLGTHLVHTCPRRQDGEKFTEARKIGPFWIDVCEDAVGHVRRAKNILNAVAIDPATVFVSFD